MPKQALRSPFLGERGGGERGRFPSGGGKRSKDDQCAHWSSHPPPRWWSRQPGQPGGTVRPKPPRRQKRRRRRAPRPVKGGLSRSLPPLTGRGTLRMGGGCPGALDGGRRSQKRRFLCAFGVYSPAHTLEGVGHYAGPRRPGRGERSSALPGPRPPPPGTPKRAVRCAEKTSDRSRQFDAEEQCEDRRTPQRQ